MSLHNVQFPAEISYGSGGGPGFRTQILESDAGRETRIGRWSTPRRQYNVAKGVQSQADFALVLDFYLARQGSLYAFRYKDWSDFTTGANHDGSPTNTDVAIATGDNTLTAFQLKKVYADTVNPIARVIALPVAGTVVVALDGTPNTNFTVSTSTGIITFDVAPGVGVLITAGFEFDTMTRFGEGTDEVLNTIIEDFESRTVSNIEVIEVVEENLDSGLFFFGGGTELCIDADYTLSLGDGRMIAVESDSSSRKIRLPNASYLPGGGPYFFIRNSGPTFNFDVTDLDGNAIGGGITLTPGDSAEVWLSINSGDVVTWEVR